MRTSLVPWTTRFPRTLSRLEREFDRMMEPLLGSEEEWLPFGGEFVPTVNLVETEEGFEVTAELPGMKPEDVHVELHENSLWISGEKKEEQEEKGKTYHRVERRSGEFRRVLPLPTPVDKESIGAEYREGVLKITLQKTEEVKPKRIEVKAG